MGVLAALGLDEAQETVYEALVLRPNATAPALASHLRLGVKVVREALHALSDKGLAMTTADARAFVAAPPGAALDALVHAQERALSQVRVHAQSLVAQAARVTELQQPEELVGIARGLEAAQTQFEQLQRVAQREVLSFDRPPYPRTGGTSVEPYAAEARARGVVYRTVYDRSVLEEPGIAARVRAEVAAGEQGRVLAHVPLKLFIADRAMAMVPLSDADSPGGLASLIVRPSVLLDSLVALFEALWERATPLTRPGEETPTVSPDVMEIATLLSAGMKDTSIARALGVNERTVRRKVAVLMDELGAETRWQAGMRARDRGWV